MSFNLEKFKEKLPGLFRSNLFEIDLPNTDDCVLKYRGHTVKFINDTIEIYFFECKGFHTRKYLTYLDGLAEPSIIFRGYNVDGSISFEQELKIRNIEVSGEFSWDKPSTVFSWKLKAKAKCL